MILQEKLEILYEKSNVDSHYDTKQSPKGPLSPTLQNPKLSSKLFETIPASTSGSNPSTTKFCARGACTNSPTGKCNN